MTGAEVERCYAEMLARFEHQIISKDVRDAWHEYLRTVPDIDTFDAALTRCARDGGSHFSSRPGQRPGVAEFAAIVNAVVAPSRRAHENDAIEALRALPITSKESVAAGMRLCREALVRPR